MKNKSLIITNIIILSCVAIGLTVLLFLGTSTNFNFVKENSELLYQKEFNLNDISLLTANIKNFDLTFKESSTNDIKIEVYGAIKNKDSIEISLNNNELFVNQTKHKSTICIGFCFHHNEIVISMPKDININTNLKAVSGDIKIDNNLNEKGVITTTSGDISLNSLNKADITSTSGDITLKNINKGSVSSTSGDITINEIKEGTITTISGDIEVNNTDSLEVSSTSGEIEISKANKLLNAKTTSGDIKIRSFNIENDSKITSTSGDITINLLNDAYIEAKTTSGDKDIKSTNGDYKLTLKTTSGDITVR
ncbi:MAG: DUF4097 domain-containing protein [Ruminococcus sp.]|nr:DUF4097 domain-containing protein [Ruminococcus sp.]